MNCAKRSLEMKAEARGRHGADALARENHVIREQEDESPHQAAKQPLAAALATGRGGAIDALDNIDGGDLIHFD